MLSMSACSLSLHTLMFGMSSLPLRRAKMSRVEVMCSLSNVIFVSSRTRERNQYD